MCWWRATWQMPPPSSTSTAWLPASSSSRWPCPALAVSPSSQAGGRIASASSPSPATLSLELSTGMLAQPVDASTFSSSAKPGPWQLLLVCSQHPTRLPYFVCYILCIRKEFHRAPSPLPSHLGFVVGLSVFTHAMPQAMHTTIKECIACPALFRHQHVADEAHFLAICITMKSI